MRNITDKFETLRTAKAEAVLVLSPEIAEKVALKKYPKGDPFPIAKAAAILAAKKTHELIPFCHPISIDGVTIDFIQNSGEITVLAEIQAIAKTGVEMEALTSASVAALTLYDMLKPLGGEMVLKKVRLLEKKGGRSSFSAAPPEELKGAVVVFSDSVYKGEKEDRAGKTAKRLLEEAGVKIVHYSVLPDDRQKIEMAITRLCDKQDLELVVTCGGTGASPRDVTPEAVIPLLEKRFEGIEEGVRAYGMKRTPYAALSRTVAGIRSGTFVLSLPGSSRGIRESLVFLLPWVFHIYRPMQMKRHD